ncbi:MAG TPA: hypothetical protein VG651_25505 [Stellaceae bacterium]|nr:hypothetical protein [Stellaceae bacterium]
MKRIGRGVAAVAAFGLATSSAFASHQPFGQSVMLEEAGLCEQYDIKIDGWIANCRGLSCDYILQVGNPTKKTGTFTVTVTELQKSWQNYLGASTKQFTARPYQWQQIRLFHSSIDQPKTTAVVLVTCGFFQEPGHH